MLFCTRLETVGGLGEAAHCTYQDEGAAAGEVPRVVLGVDDISKASVPPARRSSSFK